MNNMFETAPSAFPTPWAARSFAIVNAAAEAGLFDLKDFQRVLIASIGAKEAAGGCIGDESAYYDCWIESLSVLVRERGVTPMKLAVVEASIRERFSSRHSHHHPHDDHDAHDHEHVHGHAHYQYEHHHSHEHGVSDHAAEDTPRPIYIEQAR